MGNRAQADAPPTPLDSLLQEHGISQTELAAGIQRSKSLVSRMVSGEADPSKETIDNTLSFLSRRLRRRVTYERVFGAGMVGAERR